MLDVAREIIGNQPVLAAFLAGKFAKGKRK